jgi:hypothetical protein
MDEENITQALLHIGRTLDRLEGSHETITALKVETVELRHKIKELEEYIKNQEY